jgi:hypothetical protein
VIRSLLLILVLGICVSNVDGFSQDVEGRLMAVNEVLAPNYSIELKGSDILISGYREGEMVKVDRVNVYDLDLETLKLSPADSTVSIKCHSDFDGCVARTLTRERKKKSYRGRIAFGIDKGKSGEEIAEKLRLFMTELAQKN